MSCPNHECKEKIEEDIIKVLTNEQLFEKYQKFKKSEELSRDVYLRWCSKPDCTGYDVGSLEKQELTCNVCKFVFCYYCQEAWHGDSRCKFEADEQMDEWVKALGSKICPNCGTKAGDETKHTHLTCVKCRYESCWLCFEKISGSHYWNCKIRKRIARDPKRDLILFFLFLPLLSLFSFAIYCCKLVHQKQEDPTDRKVFVVRHKYLAYTLAVIVGIVFGPLYYLIFFFKYSIKFTYEVCCDICPNNKITIPFGIFIGILFAPILFASFVCFAGGAPFYGLFLILLKLQTYYHKRKDPYYLSPKINNRIW